MKILHAFNQPRSGGGSLASTLATIEVTQNNGHEVEIFTRDSNHFPSGLKGRVQAAISAFSAPESVKTFTTHLSQFKPDLVHINELFPLISPNILKVCKQHNVPVVMTCDDYHLTCPTRTHFYNSRICTRCIGGKEYWAVLKNCKANLPESVVNAVYNFRLRKSEIFSQYVDHFITCSEFTRRWLIEHADIDEASISAIPHAIQIPETPVDPTKGTYVSFGGRFVPEKGIDILLKAANLSGIPVKLSRNEKHFVNIDIPEYVDVVVTKGRDDLNAFYLGSRFLAFPSQWFETYGVVGAESMSHGIPVVASRLGALCNLVEDGVDGLLFDPGNAADLAEKMLRLWEDPDYCRQLGKAARQKAIKNWSPQRNFEQTLAIYQQLIR